jgi:hypothetical protein
MPDARCAFPAGRENPPGFSSCGVSVRKGADPYGDVTQVADETFHGLGHNRVLPTGLDDNGSAGLSGDRLGLAGSESAKCSHVTDTPL